MNTKFDPRFYVYIAKALRDFADGFVTIVLPAYLLALGFGVEEIGLIATSALLGSAMITLGVGYFGAHIDSRKLLISACLLMAATGVALASTHSFAWLLVIAVSELSILMWAMQALLCSLAYAGIANTARNQLHGIVTSSTFQGRCWRLIVEVKNKSLRIDWPTKVQTGSVLNFSVDPHRCRLVKA